jgi:hypothetical protein
MKTSKTILALTALLLSATASADPRNPRPDWVDAQSMEYPQETYVTGVGAGDDRATARDRARAEISKVFSTNVTVDTNLTESEDTTNKDGASSNKFSQSIAQTVKTASQKVLEGVQVVEDWQDTATRVHYALAVLERSKARAAITDKIADLDKQALQLKAEMEATDLKLAKAKAAMRLLAVLKARAGLNSELRVVDNSGQGVKAVIDEGAVRPEAAKAVAALNVSVDMTGSAADEVETAIVSGLNSFGLQASVNGKNADIGVEGKVETKAMKGDGSKWQWARSTVTISLKDPHTGKTFSRFDASDREASADYEEAARRSHVELAKRVSTQVSAAITTYFENN